MENLTNLAEFFFKLNSAEFMEFVFSKSDWTLHTELNSLIFYFQADLGEVRAALNTNSVKINDLNN